MNTTMPMYESKQAAMAMYGSRFRNYKNTAWKIVVEPSMRKLEWLESAVDDPDDRAPGTMLKS
jgi:hypothetical protein